MEKIDIKHPSEYGQRLYVVVDSSVKMPIGKLSREVAGAVTKVVMHHWTNWHFKKILSWYKCGHCTIVLKSDNLDSIITELKNEHVKTFEMIDAGKTVFKNVPTRTCIGIEVLSITNIPKCLTDLKLL